MAVDRTNLGINFDSANIESCTAVANRCRPSSISADGSRASTARTPPGATSRGETWGEETPLGQGDVDFAKFLGVLDEIGYTGPLTIEREIPQEPERQKAEIGGALTLLRSLGGT